MAPASLADEDLLALRRGPVSYVFQSFGLVPILTARENVGVPLRLRGGDAAERERRVAEALEHVGLAGHGEHRPGIRAARDRKVQSPLADCDLTKDELRALAAHWQIPIWNKPATPCLSSRIAYGEQVTPERLRMIDQAERYRTIRILHHKEVAAQMRDGVAEHAAITVAVLKRDTALACA